MNSALTRPQSIQELYKTYFSFANRFKFTDLLRNYIQNEEWKDKSQQPVWDLLSKISDDIGAVLTDDIVNYTRNVVDINTCKVPQLIEQAWMLSYKLDHLKNSYAFLPKRIQVLVDLFSINPEYLLGNHQNHILSDVVIKEILIYIRENVKDKTPFTNDDVIDRLLVDPHGLTDIETYRKFVCALFYASIVDELSSTYSSEDNTPIAFNLLWREKKMQNNILQRLDEYRSWVDKYICNEIEYPLNDSELGNTIWSTVEQVKNQKQMSTKFNPFKVADNIFFNGLNPNNMLTQDELDLVQTVIDYHSRPRYDYEKQKFVDDMSTQYGYYRELEWCEYVKLVMFVMNNIKSFGMENLTYDIASNKFIHVGTDSSDCVRVVRIFNEDGEEGSVVENIYGKVALNLPMIAKVAQFLCDYVFHIQSLRENIKTIAQKHAMRGTGALLVHIVNDFLIKELPIVRDMMYDETGDEPLKFMWETDEQFNNYGNVKILEYEDDNEYFNIDPTADVRFTERTNERYWEQLDGMGYEDSLGVLTKGQIRDFYRDVLGMGRLQPKKASNYDDVCDFLVDLFKIGANPIKWDYQENDFSNPIDDIVNKSEKDYGYTKQERLEVQNNTELRRNQERQFLAFSGNDDIIGDSIYDLVNNKIFYWKNTDYSSHVLHPFMYNLKLWNKLNNIIINGYKDYINNDLVDYLTSKVKFDELFGKFGESRNFWKYNIMDLTGYTTRYEAAIKDEHRDDFNKTTSELTGYDGLFYPDAAREFLDILNPVDPNSGTVDDYFQFPDWFFTNNTIDVSRAVQAGYFATHRFIATVYSIYWQVSEMDTYVWNAEKNAYEPSGGKEESFYLRWYSHLNYTKSEYQKIAVQLWYWRDRIQELIVTEYPITRYCLDIQGNSLIMVSTFNKGEEETNPYLIDLAIVQDEIQQGQSGNVNTHVPFCENKLAKPSELWIRWKSNPIAMPAFDLYYDKKKGDGEFDFYYRESNPIELGQLTHTNNDCNEKFKMVLSKWRDEYGTLVLGNRLPVFFDMEQSANVLALSSWYTMQKTDPDGVVVTDASGEPLMAVSCRYNPLHILSIERTSNLVSEYNLTSYSSNNSMSTPEIMQEWMFDQYHFCQANGSLLVPFYRFRCSDTGDEQGQGVSLRMFLIPAQTLKQDNYVANDRVIQLKDITIDFNEMVDFGKDNRKYRFDHPMKVCRNTNFVFSTYDKDGLNRVKCAFLGTFVKDDDNRGSDSYNTLSVKKSSCDAKTRYEYDSRNTTDLSLSKGEYFRKDNGLWMLDSTSSPSADEWNDTVRDSANRQYIDEHVAPNPEPTEEKPWESKFNSYDSMDKFVFILDFEPSIDHKSMFDISWYDGLSTYSYNILGDAGYIPHFAYQSLVRYDYGDSGGTAYTWKNKYLNRKNHMQFELLGLDDKEIPEIFENMKRLVVTDITDNCKTLLCPAKMMDDIYRVWCETVGLKRKLLKGETDPYGYRAKYDSNFTNEYRDYTNPELSFVDDGNASHDEIVWDVSSTVGLRGTDGQLVTEKDPTNREMWFGPDGKVAYKTTNESGAVVYVDGDDKVVSDISKYHVKYVDDGLFELEIPRDEQEIDDLPETTPAEKAEKERRRIEAFKTMLDEYYVCVLRTSNGEILNEKRYLMQPTPISQFILGMGDEEGYMKCNLSPYQTSLVQDNHFVKNQVVFTGTQNPFRYDNDGERIYSKSEELQYGNCLAGVDSIELKIEITSEQTNGILKYDEKGNVIIIDEHVDEHVDVDGNKSYSISVNPDFRTSLKKKLKPFVRFKKTLRDAEGLELSQKVHQFTNVIPEGEIAVIFSHKNMDNIAKYHILSKSSDLYFGGALAKNKQNQIKFSDFKCDMTLLLEEYQTNMWRSVAVDETNLDAEGEPTPFIQFTLGEVKPTASGSTPPYYVEIDREVDGETVHEKWFLEQNGIVPSPDENTWNTRAKATVTPPNMVETTHTNRINGLKTIGHSLDKGAKTQMDSKSTETDYYGNQTKCHMEHQENGMVYPKPTKGRFLYAHRAKARPEKYLDYLYIKNGWHAFKVSEESWSFGEAMSKLPPFYVDEALRNKIADLNDVQVLKEYSTFIHQSENPDVVKRCNNFNPLLVDAILKYGLEQKEIPVGYNYEWDSVHKVWKNTRKNPMEEDNPVRMICTEKWRKNNSGAAVSTTQKLIEMDNATQKTRLALQFEDGELDDYLKIYTNYVRVDDGYGDFHYDLYFNIQNLFNSPFEYISTVTNQPNVLILENSYLYLPGAKYKRAYDEDGKWTHNEIDDELVKKLRKGDELVIYGQIKTYSNDQLSDVRTIKLFAYNVYNISDDKPKFLIEKTYDITKSTLQNNLKNTIRIEFSDVLWTIDENQFVTESDKGFSELNQDIIVVQPVNIRYNWNKDDDYRLNSIQFDIMNDIIDFNNVPELCEYWRQARTLRNGEVDKMEGISGNVRGKAYYDHWSDSYIKLDFNEETKVPRLTLTYNPEAGYNYETIYLRWKLSRGCRIMDTIDRLGGYVFSSTAGNIVADCNNNSVTPDFQVTTGHVVARVHEIGQMYLGLEHSSTHRMSGYVLKELAASIRDAIGRGYANPTLDRLNSSGARGAIPEEEIREKSADIIL